MKHRLNKQKPGRKPEKKFPPGKTPPSAPAAPLSAGRKWLFRFIALFVVPVLLLGGVEVGLRLAGYGYPTGFFKKIHRDGKDYFINNENFTLRFFPPQLARWPDPFLIPAVKSPDTIRVFIFGESAAMGDLQPAYGASRFMEVQLRERFPGKQFEVANLGITAINSHVILPIARECAKHDGDFWVIYMGNNEMVGPFGTATVFGAQALPRQVAQVNIELQRTRLGQLLVAAVRQSGGRSKNTSWGGMEMFLGNRVAPDDRRKETVYRNFAANLRDIVRAGLNSGAKVVLSTVSVNLKDSPPFASLANTNLPAADRAQFDQDFAGGKLLQSQSNFLAAAERFRQAAQLDPEFAETHFRLAQCELALTNVAAREQFQIACDDDALPFRADSRINTIIRQVAQRYAGERLALCDAERELAAASPAGIAGEDIFLEHVHFNFDGNYRLGKLWAEQIAQSLAAAGVRPAGTNWLSPEACDRALGLTIWNRQFGLQAKIQRLGDPPLSTQFNNPERIRKLQDEELQLRQLEAQPGAAQRAREVFAAALERAPSDKYVYEGLANFCEANHDWQGALAAYRRMTELMPADFYACLQLGRLLGEQGQPAQGEPFLEEAAHLRPSLPTGWLELGSVLLAQQKYAAALDCLKHAMQLRPQDPSYVCSAGRMLAKLDRHAEAMADFRRSIQLDPNYWQAHFELADELNAANQPEEAAREYNAVLNLNPRHVPSYIKLGLVLVRFNRLDDATACFQNALKLEPDNRIAQECLAAVLARKAQQR
ncbi:MAG TPA: tetratricopeptide repeat protein [Verrucomicrobiae bacterium]|nr:tetratricopeptide repeat protein [Verrucomicrobiae bacterium]